jgi:hypothetical protein
MAKQPTPPPIRWDIYRLALEQTWIGEVCASDKREAIRRQDEITRGDLKPHGQTTWGWHDLTAP